MVTPNEYTHILTTVTMSVCLRRHQYIRAEGSCLCIYTNPLCGAGPEIHPNNANRLAMTSIPRMAPTSCHDGHVPAPRVTKISQFCYDKCLSVRHISLARVS